MKALWLCIFFFLLMSFGCSRNSGPERYDLSGSITFDGKPVPAGYIMLAPDKSKGNEGPGTSAEIKDGLYRTRPHEGTVGGPHIATINGFDGVVTPNNLVGKRFFPTIQIAVDLPRESSTYDLVVPGKKR